MTTKRRIAITDECGQYVAAVYVPEGTIDFESATLEGFAIPGLTTLRGRSFRNAMMYWAMMAGADLSGCNFDGAELRGANLIDASLIGAKLTDAILVWTILAAPPPSRVQISQMRFWIVQIWPAPYSISEPSSRQGSIQLLRVWY